MRRTDQEFKAEILRRSDAYRAKQKQMRKELLITAACFVLVVFGFRLVMPMLAMGGATESVTADGMYNNGSVALGDSVIGEPEEKGNAIDTEENMYMESIEICESGRQSAISIQVYRWPDLEEPAFCFTDSEIMETILTAIEDFRAAADADEPARTGNTAEAYDIVITYSWGEQRYTMSDDALSSESDGWIGVSQEAYDALSDVIFMEANE